MDTVRLPARLGLLFWLVLAATFYGLTFRFDDAGGNFAWGPAAWPRAVLLLMMVAAIVNYIANRPGREASGGAGWSMDRGEIVGTLAMIAAPLVYVWLMPRMGFYVATLVFLPVYMRLLGERRWPYVAGVTVFLFVVVNLMFTRLFYVALPTGRWPGFYDVSNWLVTFIRM